MRGTREDRDIIDYVTTFCAIAALVSSVAVPFIIRYYDQKSQQPQVELSAEYLYPVSPSAFPEIRSSVIKSIPKLEHAQTIGDFALESISYVIPWFFKYQLFEVNITNMRNIQVSISHFNVTSLDFEGPYSIEFAAMFLLHPDLNNLQSDPILTVAPYDILKAKILVGFTLFPNSEEEAKEMHRLSRERLMQLNARSNVSQLDVRKDFFFFEGLQNLRKLPTIDEMIYSESQAYVFREIYEEIFEKVRFERLKITARTNAGQILESSLVSMR